MREPEQLFPLTLREPFCAGKRGGGARTVRVGGLAGGGGERAGWQAKGGQGSICMTRYRQWPSEP